MLTFSTNVTGTAPTLTGRSALVGRITDALKSGGVVLVGPAGVGKTALARSVAHASLSGPWDGVFWVDAAPLPDRASVDTAIGDALGIDTHNEPGQLERAIASRGRVLVVLDDAEHLGEMLEDRVADLVESCPGCALLVTTRVRPLTGLETVRVPPLSTQGAGPLDSPAARLLLRRARQERGDALDASEATAVARLVTALDGLPLALELAAARMRALGAAELLERLDPTVLADRRREGRHRSLSAAIEASWELLEPHEREVLGRLAHWDGAFDLAAVEAAATDLPDDWLPIDVALALVDHSWLSVERAADGASRYRMLPTLKAWARAKAPVADTASMDSWLADHLQSKPVEILAAWRPSALAAIERSLDRDEPVTAARLLLVLVRLLRLRGPVASFPPLAERVLEVASDRSHAALDALFVARCAEQRDPADIEALQGRAEAAAAAGDPVLAGLAWAAASRCTPDPSQALERQRRAVPLFERHARERLSDALVSQATLQYLSTADAEGTLETLLRARAEARSVGDELVEARAIHFLGMLHHQRGEIAAATTHLQLAASLFDSLGALEHAAATAEQLAVVALEAGDMREARARGEAALSRYRLAGSARWTVQAMAACALADELSGDLQAALETLRDSTEQARANDLDVIVAGQLGMLARVQSRLGRPEAARRSIDEARALLPPNPQMQTYADLLEAHVILAESSTDTRPWERLDAHRPTVDPLVAGSADLRIAWRELDRDLADRPAPEAGLRVATDGSRFALAGQEPVDLEQRVPVKRVLAALFEARRSDPSANLDVDALFAAGWPGEQALGDSSRNRVYNAITTLRRWGLKEWIERHEGGYRLRADALILPLTDPGG